MTRAWERLSTSRFVREDLRAAALPWLLARVVVLVSFWVSQHVDEKVLRGRHFNVPDLGLFIYDGAWYRSIAEQGYTELPRQGLRFFPLYPLLGRGLGEVFAGHVDVALIAISAIAALVLGALVHRLVVNETGDERTAGRAAWLVALFPAALSFTLAYAEPLFMVMAVGMFLALRSQRWVPVAALGVMAGLTRPVGLLLVVPAAIEVARGWRESALADRIRRLAAVVAPGVGTAIYLAWVGIEYDDPLLAFSVQSRADLRGPTVDPFTHVVNAIGDLFDGDRFGAGLHLVWFVVFAALVVVLARRLSASYAAYGAVTLVLALTASNISSFDRYAYSTFVFAIGAAIVTARAEIERGVLVVATAGLSAYAVLSFFELYVP